MQLIVFFGQATAVWHSYTIDSDLFDNFAAVVVDNVSDFATSFQIISLLICSLGFCGD